MFGLGNSKSFYQCVPTTVIQLAYTDDERDDYLVAFEKFVVADLVVEIGHFHGQTCKAIFRLDGDTLYYSGSYESRPTGFQDGSGYTVPWKRVKK